MTSPLSSGHRREGIEGGDVQMKPPTKPAHMDGCHCQECVRWRALEAMLTRPVSE